MSEEIPSEITSFDEITILLSEFLFGKYENTASTKKPNPLLHHRSHIESVSIWSIVVSFPQNTKELHIRIRTNQYLRIGREYKGFGGWIFDEFKELAISSIVDVESEELHSILFATKVIIIPLDIILASICTTLYLYDHEWFGPSIGETMQMSLWDMASLIGTEHPELLRMHEVGMTEIDRRHTRYYDPVLTTMLV